MTKRANLHFHSVHSDGRQWPGEMAARCAGARIDTAALTDHDTLAGVPEFLAACRHFGVEGVAGVEIDCVEAATGYDKELLGYFPAGGYAATEAFLAPGLARRAALMEGFIEEARERFGRPDLSMDGLLRYKLGRGGPAAAGVPIAFIKVDLFRYLKAAGALPPEADYRDFKRAGFKAETPKPTLAETAAAIRRDGGFPVLPHPGFFLAERGPGAFARLLSACREAGVWGVELYWYENEGRSAEMNAAVRAAAGPLGFRFTHGSDCHGRGSEFDTLERYDGPFEGFA